MAQNDDPWIDGYFYPDEKEDIQKHEEEEETIARRIQKTSSKVDKVMKGMEALQKLMEERGHLKTK